MPKKMNRLRRFLAVGSLVLALLALLMITPLQQGIAAQREYVIGLIPSGPPVDMHTRWAPFVGLLERETSVNFKLKVYDKMQDFESDVGAGGPDFIFASPTQMVPARKTQGYIPLVRSSMLVAANIFVRKDSPIQSIKDLEGKEIAFVGAKSL